MANNRRKLSSGRIYAICLAIYTVILAIACCIALSFVWDFAEEYEVSRPNRAMDAYVAELSENLWGDGIADAISAMDHEVQSDAECAEVIKDMLSGEISYSRQAGSSAENDGVKYTLRCDGKTFGYVTWSRTRARRIMLNSTCCLG